MMTSLDGIEILHYFERLRLKAYPDPYSPRGQSIVAGREDASLDGSPWTIGWGDTGPDVVEGMIITPAEADARFAKRLSGEFEPGVSRAVRVPLTQRQFDALVCLAYNIGLPRFRTSTLLSMLNRGLVQSASNQFLAWNRSGGKVSLGLRRRRAAEKAVFDGKTARHGIALAAALR